VRIADASGLYETAHYATATRELVDFEPVRLFARTAKRFLATSADWSEDDLMVLCIRRMWRMLRQISSAPLPLSHAALGLGEASLFLDSLLTQLTFGYPDNVVALGRLAQGHLAALAGSEHNPLGDAALDVLRTGDLERSALLVRSTPYIDPVQGWIDHEAAGVRVLLARQLEDIRGLESMVVVGPSCWYPAHVVNAPRAELLTFAHYRWVRDTEPNAGLFAGAAVASIRTPRDTTHPPAEVGALIDAEEIAPKVDWDALAAASGASPHAASDEADTVPASLLLLAGGYSVYLETLDGPTIYVVDPEADGAQRLRSDPARSVSPGTYIVLRSAGTRGDFIHEIANRHLGQRAEHVRALQSQWKEALRGEVRQKGFSRVERELRQMGVEATNLRYRLHPQSIRTRNPRDFALLLRYVGLGDRIDAVWAAMERIAEAHVSAGQEVRRLLEQKVLSSDLSELKRSGWRDIELEDSAAGTLSILRVEARSPETRFVPEGWLRVLEKVEPDLWQE